MQTEFIQSIHAVSAGEWDALFNHGAGLSNPFVQHAFLAALEDSRCVGGATGWQPGYLLLRDAGGLAGAMPLYGKDHSYGEFVFDWSWAQAYQRHGLAYYPKLLTAVPFTPSRGPRLGIAPGRDRQLTSLALVTAALQRVQEQGYSGWHLLFPEQEPAGAREQGLLRRQDVQFHWHNRDYADFDAFLAQLKSSRRKSLRRERRRIAEQGVVMQRLQGGAISDTDWDDFYRCYVATYLKRSGHGGYLNRDFFHRLRRSMPEQLMLVVARREGRMVAGSLFLFDDQVLYGRYWGALEEVQCLHFESCFYQGIEFCIANNLRSFDPGTQGEHKLLRGFEPLITESWHWLADPRFRAAIADFLRQERDMTEQYGAQAGELLPYRRDL